MTVEPFLSHFGQELRPGGYGLLHFGHTLPFGFSLLCGIGSPVLRLLNALHNLS